MNILIVHNLYQIPGGEEVVACGEQKMLQAHGHRVLTYFRNNGELSEFPLWKKMCLPFSVLWNPRTYREVRKIIRENKIDLVHVHNTLMLVSPAVYYAARKEGAAVVQTVHNFRLLCPGATFYRQGHVCEDCLEKGLGCALKHRCYRGSFAQTLCCVLSMKLHRATGIYKKLTYICLTEFNRQKLLRLPGLRPERVFVKANAVEQTLEPLPGDRRKKQILFAGRLDELKGIRVLLEGWRLLGAEGPELLICGSGPLEDWCREFIESNGLHNVRLLGFVPNDQVRLLLRESRAMVLPTQWYEGFPMSIAEAFSMGTPVLVSRLGNGGSLIEEGLTGMKFRGDDPQSLADTVAAFWEREQDWTEAVLARYKKDMAPEENYRCLTEIYKKAMEQRQ